MLSTLLHAYAQVNQIQFTALLVVGDVCTSDATKRFEELKSSIPEAKITVTSYVSNHHLPSYYSLMDVIVHPSLRDGMPNVLNDCVNGRIVTVNDVHSLSKVLQEVLSDKTQQQRLGASARETSKNKYALQNELDGNLEVYCKLGLKT